jgi:hypothetical protein
MAANIFYGHKAVTAAGTPEQLTNTTFKAYVVTIKALAANTGDIYVGDGDVDNSNGFVLDAGEEVTIFVDNVDTDIYIDSEVNGEGVSFIGWIDRGILYKDE